jgi:transcription elongation factor S-II
LDILQSLKRLSLTAELIRSTKIGLCVNNIKKNYDGEVGRLAKELVHVWRNIYQSSSAAATAENPSPTKSQKVSAVVEALPQPPSTSTSESDQSSTPNSPRPDPVKGGFNKLELDSLPEGRRNVCLLALPR